MKDIHTHEKAASFQLIMMRKYLRCMEAIHFKKAKQTTINLFCKPQASKIKKVHDEFYRSGKTIDVSSEGYDIKVWTKGNGPVVFVCHGWNSKGANMRHLIEKIIKEGFTVIVPDLPCHGRSGGKYVNQVQMSLVLKDLLIYFNGIQKIDYLVTHSWGGTATLLAMDEELGLDLKRVISLSMPTQSEAISNLFKDILNLSPRLSKALDEELIDIALSADKKLNEVFPLGFKQVFDRGDTKYVLIHDQDDDIIPISDSRKLVEKYKHIDLLETKGLGHRRILRDERVQDMVVNYLIEEEINSNRKEITHKELMFS
jgi:esterase/lipase